MTPSIDPLTGHRWETERIYPRRRACAMPASWRRRCVVCGQGEFRSSSLGADWVATNRPANPCRLGVESRSPDLAEIARAEEMERVWNGTE